MTDIKENSFLPGEGLDHNNHAPVQEEFSAVEQNNLTEPGQNQKAEQSLAGVKKKAPKPTAGSDGISGPGDMGDFGRYPDDEPLAVPQPVTVKMFNREYQIKSDQPHLVEFLASEVNKEAQKLKMAQPNMGPGSFDWPVQVAFQMALNRYYAQKALAKLRARVEDESEKMAAQIEAELNKII